ncbi:chitin-binding lectin 1-like [Papaver somniferum]|uniref:chitin-binding lectin 1-like n=1 Tax=Papaver somniferum TaxID=3469 RepID=UPI000E704EE2|nr:chitin-binding lectin 1-like [Papaver somniferum]
MVALVFCDSGNVIGGVNNGGEKDYDVDGGGGEVVNELKCPAREDSYSWARVDTNWGAICDCCCTPPPPPPAPSPVLCPAREDSYSWATDTSCSACAKKSSTSPSPSSPPPPPPSTPSPSPPPPSPLPPSPTGDKCDKSGDTYSEITYPTSDCTYCTNWCKDECSEMKAKVVSNKCSIGE